MNHLVNKPPASKNLLLTYSDLIFVPLIEPSQLALKFLPSLDKSLQLYLLV